MDGIEKSKFLALQGRGVKSRNAEKMAEAKAKKSLRTSSMQILIMIEISHLALQQTGHKASAFLSPNYSFKAAWTSQPAEAALICACFMASVVILDFVPFFCI